MTPRSLDHSFAQPHPHPSRTRSPDTSALSHLGPRVRASRIDSPLACQPGWCRLLSSVSSRVIPLRLGSVGTIAPICQSAQDILDIPTAVSSLPHRLGRSSITLLPSV